MTAEVPVGGVGSAGAGGRTGTNAGTTNGSAGWMKNGVGGAGAGRTGGGVAATSGGAGGTGTTGGEPAGAGPAGAGAGEGGGTGAATLAAAAARCFCGTVPHGSRTLPACTVTGSEDFNPPASIVTVVAPWK